MILLQHCRCVIVHVERRDQNTLFQPDFYPTNAQGRCPRSECPYVYEESVKEGIERNVFLLQGRHGNVFSEQVYDKLVPSGQFLVGSCNTSSLSYFHATVLCMYIYMISKLNSMGN